MFWPHRIDSTRAPSEEPPPATEAGPSIRRCGPTADTFFRSGSRKTRIETPARSARPPVVRTRSAGIVADTPRWLRRATTIGSGAPGVTGLETIVLPSSWTPGGTRPPSRSREITYQPVFDGEGKSISSAGTRAMTCLPTNP